MTKIRNVINPAAWHDDPNYFKGFWKRYCRKRWIRRQLKAVCEIENK